jgi:hypothetical protein
MEEVTENGDDGHADDDQNGNQNLDNQNQQRMDHNSIHSESQNGDGNLQPGTNGVAGNGGTQVAKLVPGVCFSPTVKRMIEKSKQFLRSYVLTNEQKQKDDGFSVSVQNEQGKDEVRVQLPTDNNTVTCDMESSPNVAPTDPLEVVVGQQPSEQRSGAGRQGMSEGEQYTQSHKNQGNISEVPDSLQTVVDEGVESFTGCPLGTPTLMASPTSGGLGHHRVSGNGQSATSMIKPTMEQLVAFGGISEPSSNGVRSSGRIRAQPNADMTQMERAVQLAQRRDDHPPTGTNTTAHPYILNMPSDEIISKASRLGISLGNSSEEILKSVHRIKSLEADRNVTFLKNNLNNLAPTDSLSLVVSRASSLSEDLDDDECENVMDHAHSLSLRLIDNKTGRRKRKDKEVKLAVRKSARILKIKSNKR